MTNIYKILDSFNKVAQEPVKAEPQPKAKTQLQESMEQVLAKKLAETKVDYSAKKARAGQDIGKPGKQFAKIAKGAAERYGSKERGEKVAGAVLAKLRAKESVAEGVEEALLRPDNPIAKGLRSVRQGAKDSEVNALSAVGSIGGAGGASAGTALAAGAGSTALFLPALGAGLLAGAAIWLGGKLTIKTLEWLARKVFGSKEQALEFAKAHLAAAQQGARSFTWNGKTYPVKVTNPQQIEKLKSEIFDLGTYMLENNNAVVAEGLRLVAKHGNGAKTAKVYKDQDWGEFRVKFYTNGQYEGEDSDHHTDDKDDAMDTAKSWITKGVAEGKSHISPSGVKTTMDPQDDDYEINYGKNGLVAKFRKDQGVDVKTGSKKVKEAKKAKNPYAIGMAQAMKSTGDTPPLKKATIKKAHEIAKKIKEDASTFIANRGEYGMEGDHAKDDIRTLIRDAEALESILSDAQDLPEWVQAKLTRAKSMMSAISDYMQTQRERDAEDNMMKEEVRVHKGKYGTEYQGDEDEDDKDKKAEPQVKRGRGRPKKGADNTGVVKKYSGDALSKAMGGGEKPKAKGKPSAVHKIKESTAKIDRMVMEAMDPDVEAKGLSYEQNQLKKAIGNEMFDQMMQQIESGQEVDDTIIEELMNYFIDSGEMPYGTAKAREGDPYQWISNKLDELFPYSGDKSPSDYMGEDDMEEGNAFTGALAKAKADGVQPGETMKVGDKEYPVKEEQAELAEMKRLAGLQECGEMSPISGQTQDTAGSMQVTTSFSSDGHKSVSINATGDAAGDLMNMLKLAGMSVQVAEAKVEEAKDPRYEASTTPDVTVLPVQAQIKGGDGDVAGQEKVMDPDGSARFSDNPMAVKKVKESKDEIDSLENMGLNLLQDYESIKKVVEK